MEKNTVVYEDAQRDEFLTFAQTAQRFPAFSEGSLRWMRFHGTSDFNKCVRKIGKKCVISVRDFNAWIDSQTAQNHSQQRMTKNGNTGQ